MNFLKLALPVPIRITGPSGVFRKVGSNHPSFVCTFQDNICPIQRFGSFLCYLEWYRLSKLVVVCKFVVSQLKDGAAATSTLENFRGVAAALLFRVRKQLHLLPSSPCFQKTADDQVFLLGTDSVSFWKERNARSHKGGNTIEK